MRRIVMVAALLAWGLGCAAAARPDPSAGAGGVAPVRVTASASLDLDPTGALARSMLPEPAAAVADDWTDIDGADAARVLSALPRSWRVILRGPARGSSVTPWGRGVPVASPPTASPVDTFGTWPVAP